MNFYDDNAASLSEEYEALDPAGLHSRWAHLLPDTPGLALDLGAGSGRDAAWLRRKGWEVVAAEPSSGMRREAERRHPGSIHWIDDKLPDLYELRELGYQYSLILASAVWMHVPPGKQDKALRNVANLLAPGGLLVITIREGDDGAGRGFYPVNTNELRKQALSLALDPIQHDESDDYLGRDDVRWETIVFRMPDDGTGGLPVLRNIIVNDDKSSTYKLGLLKALVRSADGSPGLARRIDDDCVAVPFGLVALNWLRIYTPLIYTYKLPQLNNPRLSCGFAKEQFWDLANHSRHGLHPGMPLPKETARLLTPALNHIAETIQRMPAHYTTWPTGGQIFGTQRETVRGGPPIIDDEYLRSFGEVMVPSSLWTAMTHHACWLEPAIDREWASIMRRWMTEEPPAPEVVYRTLVEEEVERDTSTVRGIVKNQLVENGQTCVWTGRSIKEDSFEVDHCLPWARWYNNDLWNLIPSTKQANRSKSDDIPSAEVMLAAKERFMRWWDLAYTSKDRNRQFIEEARSSLPGVRYGDLEEIFGALMLQRTRLRVSQQIREWNGLNE